MPWDPIPTLLLTTDEIKNFSRSITYTTDLGFDETVTITPLTISDENATVDIFENTISGYFSDSFPNTQIQYRTLNDTFVNVTRFVDINISELSEMIYYKPDPTISKTYSYLATSETSSQTYTIIVMNNWSVGRDTLIRFVGLTLPLITVKWINTDNNIVGWTNTSEQTIDWTKIS